MTALTRRIGFALLAVAFVGTASAAEQGLKITNKDFVRIVYPFDLAMAGTDATVEVSYRVDTDGGASSVKVTKTSNPDAAAAFVAALDEMIFETAKADGKPVVSGEQTLSTSIRQVQLPQDLEFISTLKDPKTVIVTAKDVDGGMKPVATMAPAIFPTSLLKSSLTEGQAVLEFYVDQGGIVRMPKVLSATDPALGWSAASSVLTWRFAPPMKGGKSVIVKVTGLPVLFKKPAEPAAAPAGP